MTIRPKRPHVSTSGWQLSQPRHKPVSEEAILEVTPAAPAIPTSNQLSHQSWGLRHHGAQRNCSHCALTKFLSLKLWKHRMVVFVTIFGDSLLCSNKLQNRVELGGILLYNGWVLKRRVSPTARLKAQVLELGCSGEHPSSAPQCISGLVLLLNLFSFFSQVGV